MQGAIMHNMREKVGWAIAGVLALFVVVSVTGVVHSGPLDPPGPPAATDGVLIPGTPISSLPFIISQPGYYYVTRSLTGGAGQAGITVSTSNVTIDLGGFTLGGGASPGAGVSVGAFRNVAIRNGALRVWSYGIDAAGCGNCRVEGVQASSNINTGIKIGQQSEVSDCNASLNLGYGIDADHATVRNCTMSENGAAGIALGSNSLVEDSRVNANPNLGIGILGDRNMVRDNQLSGNTGTDVHLDAGATANVLIDNVYCTGADFGTATVGVGNNC
jgi:hypothetical protein